MRLSEIKTLENVHLLCLVPDKADFLQIWELYRKELVKLQNEGFKINDHTEKRYFVRLAVMKADSPQRADHCDHVSGNADLFCPKCDCRKKDLWNLQFNVFKHHHQVGFIEMIHLLKEELTPEEFEQLKKKYGYHGIYNMFKDLNFNVFNQLSSEPYHL